MLETSEAYRKAITGSFRQVFLRAVVDISDPDKVMGEAVASSSAPWSRMEALTDHNFSAPPRYATLERNRWLLDGSFGLFPEDYQVPGPVGYAGAVLSGADGRFAQAQWVEQPFSDVYVLQALSVFFSSDPLDGVAADFTVEVCVGGKAVYTRAFVGNRAAVVSLDGFTVYNPDAIRVTVTRWSLPGRRVRLTEILLGVYEDWDADMLERFSVTQQGAFSCLSLPYGSAEIAIDNRSRRFDPRRKDGIFQSIEQRQNVDLFLGVRTDGVEYLSLGRFYQAGDGWKSGSNDLTIQWSLVDIIGLLANRTFLPAEPLPTTLAGWMQAVVLQLGEAFRKRYQVDPTYAELSVTAGSLEDVTGKKCGDIIRWACQATGTWPRAAADTGRLTAEPLWNQGGRLDLDNLASYPAMKANRSLAALIFTLADGEHTEFVVSGNATSSEDTVAVKNPFIHTRDQALAAARLILAQYGGNIIETTGRGDPSSEIGDVDTIWLDESNAVTARRMSQTFQIQDHALQNCRSTLLQADGSYLWTEFAVIRVSGRWRAPPGVRQLRLVLGQAGQGGGPGSPGHVGWAGNLGNQVEARYGDKGVDGQGGAVWYGVIDINPEQEFDVHLGAGGAAGVTAGVPGAPGEHTTFGPYSSENGRVYPNGYTDIANGQSFARAGVAVPLPGTGDGGQGGEGGDPGVFYVAESEHRPNPADPSVVNKRREIVTVTPPSPGQPGVAGATGFAMVAWDRPET